MKIDRITRQRLFEVFHYDEITGLVTTKISRKYNQPIGKIVGSLTENGYLYAKVDGVSYQLHRLVFLMYHGYLPEFIDHIDGNKLNNSIDNLREATREQNRANMGAYKNNELGLKGVQFSEKDQRAIGQVKVDNVRYWKSFRVTAKRNKQQAIIEAFLYCYNIRRKVHGEFVNHGFSFELSDTYQADLLEIASGFTPIDQVWAERGYSREQLEASIQTMKDMGLFELLMQPQQSPAQNNGEATTATTGS